MAGVELLSFDCYGTLIDWEQGMVRALEGIKEKYGISESLEKLAERYVEIELQVEQEKYRRYSEVMEIALSRLLREKGITPEPDDEKLFVKTLPTWPPFPETRETLKTLKRKGYKLSILSNIDNDLISHSIQLIGVDFDLVITAEKSMSYKPSPKHWELLLKESGVEKDRILHVAASLVHDIRPAKQLGFKTAWINRKNEPTPSDVKPDYIFPDLKPLATIL